MAERHEFLISLKNRGHAYVYADGWRISVDGNSYEFLREGVPVISWKVRQVKHNNGRPVIEMDPADAFLVEKKE